MAKLVLDVVVSFRVYGTPSLLGSTFCQLSRFSWPKKLEKLSCEFLFELPVSMALLKERLVIGICGIHNKVPSKVSNQRNDREKVR